MKNRVLLTMLIIFIVLSGVWIACGTIFVVREIEIIDTRVETSDALTVEEKSDIITKSGLRGKNILFSMDENQIAQSVKLVNPKIKLQSVTAHFPNRVVLVLSRRVPIYYDGNHYYDAEMCKVDGTSSDCVDITSAQLNLAGNLNYGDMAVGRDEATKSKINQLKIVASCFDSITNFEIGYESALSKTTCMVLKIKPRVTFKIIVDYHADFLHALKYTLQIYNNQQKQDGDYETFYGFEKYTNKVTTRFGGVEYEEK